MSRTRSSSAPDGDATPEAGSDALSDRLPDLAVLLDNLREADRRELEDAFLRVLTLSRRDRPSSLPEQIGSVSAEEAAAARAQTLARATAVRTELVTDSLSTAEVAVRLGISAAAVTKRRGKDELIAFRHRGDWRYPAWQIADGEVIPGLIAVWRAMPTRAAIGKVRWFVLDDRALGDRTPLRAVLDGDVARVVDAATYVGSR